MYISCSNVSQAVPLLLCISISDLELEGTGVREGDAISFMYQGLCDGCPMRMVVYY